MKTKVCSICDKEFTEWGNNPRPLQRGLCCDDCNKNVILPLRAFEAKMNDIKTGMLIKTGSDIKENISYVKVNGLKDMQKSVEGYIETYPVKYFDDFVFLVNEEGLLKHLKPNILAQELYGIRAVGNVLVIRKQLWLREND